MIITSADGTTRDSMDVWPTYNQPVDLKNAVMKKAVFSSKKNVVSVGWDYDVKNSDDVIICDTSAGNVLLNFDNVSLDKDFYIKNVGGQVADRVADSEYNFIMYITFISHNNLIYFPQKYSETGNSFLVFDVNKDTIYPITETNGEDADECVILWLYDSKIYFFGWRDQSNKCYYYDINSDTRTNLPDSPVWIKNCWMINSNLPLWNSEFVFLWKWKDYIWFFDVATETWTQWPAVPEMYRSLDSWVLDWDTIYAMRFYHCYAYNLVTDTRTHVHDFYNEQTFFSDWRDWKYSQIAKKWNCVYAMYPTAYFSKSKTYNGWALWRLYSYDITSWEERRFSLNGIFAGPMLDLSDLFVQRSLNARSGYAGSYIKLIFHKLKDKTNNIVLQWLTNNWKDMSISKQDASYRVVHKKLSGEKNVLKRWL